jgi:hypothetical protein
LLLDTGIPSQPNLQRFKFELSWLFKNDFYEMVARTWRSEKRGSNVIEIWQNKIRALRRYLRGWAKNNNGAFKMEKKEIISKLDELDKKAEGTLLAPHEVDLRQCLRTQLIQLLREEEVKWYQRSKTEKIIYGDSNTKYFHLVANGKHRKTRIFQLEEEDHLIQGDDQLSNYIMDYYQGLFGHTEDDYLTLDERVTEDIQQVSPEENEMLTAVFTKKEVKEAIFQMKHNKALWPDGFPVEFYHIF